MVRRILTATVLTWMALYFAVVGYLGAFPSWIVRDFAQQTTPERRFATSHAPASEIPTASDSQGVQDDRVPAGEASSADAETIEEFDVSRDGHWLIVPVTIAGREYPFAVDTGLSLTIVDLNLRHRLKLERQQGTQINKWVTFCTLPDAFVGRSRVRVTGEVVCHDLGDIRWLTDNRIRGILGMSFLRSQIVRLDLAAGKLAFLRSLPASPRARFELQYSHGCPAIDVRFTKDHAAQFVLDTGCAGPIGGTLSTSTFDELQQAGCLCDMQDAVQSVTLRGVESGRRGIVAECRVGQIGKHNLEFIESKRNFLGLRYLSRFRVTFDFPRDQLYLEEEWQSGERGTNEISFALPR